jgi:GntR family transcriptional regulator/MocR family aminotransferase
MLQLPLKVERGRQSTLQIQLFEQIRRFVLDGRLKPGMMLPSSRALAENLGISRHTVMLAYERLFAEGYLETKAAARTMVSQGVADLGHLGAPPRPPAGPDGLPPSMCATRYPVVFRGAKMRLDRDSSRMIADFFVGRPGADTFPNAIWRRLLLQQLAKGGTNLTQYGNPAGLDGLREAIAHHLGPARGMRVTPDRVMIVNGIQEGMNVVSRLFITSATPVAIENPSYQGAAAVFESQGARLFPVPVDRDGIDPARLPDGRFALLYLTASHQYPTGATLPLERRLAALLWARRTGTYILEDDYDSDFRYDRPPLTAIAGLDSDDVVIYMGTFSKSIGAGLRLGYLVLPPDLIEPAIRIKSLLNNGHNWLDQAVLAEFIRTGAFARHLQRIRKIYRARRDSLLAALGQYFGTVDVTGELGGMHVMWHLPSNLPAAIEVEHIARRHGIGVYSLHSGAAHCIGAVPCVERGLIFGYTALPERMIAKGIARLAEALGAQNARRALIATPSLANNAYPAGTPGDAASGSSTSPRGV